MTSSIAVRHGAGGSKLPNEGSAARTLHASSQSRTDHRRNGECPHGILPNDRAFGGCLSRLHPVSVWSKVFAWLVLGQQLCSDA